MASKANQRRDGKSDKGGVITRLCSINSTGLVFVSQRRMKLSAEVTMEVETDLFGFKQHWSLQGWVVECRHLRDAEDQQYQVTLLLSDMPKALQHTLELASGSNKRAFPRLGDSDVYGMN